MFTPFKSLTPLMAIALSLSPAAMATDTPMGDITEFDIEDLLNMSSSIATKQEVDARRVPAVVTVVTAAEIQARGLQDLASILATVPGFYDINDHNNHNIGVRGVNGGLRAMGSVIKVMVDGVRVTVRSTSGNFFGPELLPVQAIERVEIIRGPASALYGADAFLGAINIVTRDGAEENGVVATGHGGLVAGKLAMGQGLLVMGGGDDASLMFSYGRHTIDRSGLEVSSSSPELARSGETLSGAGPTENDLSTPQSAVLKISVGEESDRGRVTLWGGFQQLTSGGEFHDIAPLTHATTLSLDNSQQRLAWDYDPNEQLSLSLWGGLFSSAPGDDDAISVGLDDRLMLRKFGTTGWEVGAELRREGEVVDWIFGYDFTDAYNQTQTFDTLFTEDIVDAEGVRIYEAGTVLPGSGPDENHVHFHDHGIYTQVVGDIGSSLSVTAGARADVRDRNGYSYHISPRLAVVLAPPEVPWNTKLMFGSSYKAPTPEQLYTEPLREFDIMGNTELEDQFAETGEFAFGYRFGDVGYVQANSFLTLIRGKVEYIQEGIFFTAQNAVDELVAGAEVDTRLSISDEVTMRLGLGIADTVNREVRDEIAVYSNINVENPQFPMLQLHLIPEVKLLGGDLHITPELSWVSERPSSLSNASVAGEVYTLPSYAMTSLALALPNVELVEDYPLSLSMRVSNLLNSDVGYPGFGGIDYPDLGRTVWLTIHQGLL